MRSRLTALVLVLGACSHAPKPIPLPTGDRPSLEILGWSNFSTHSAFTAPSLGLGLNGVLADLCFQKNRFKLVESTPDSTGSKPQFWKDSSGFGSAIGRSTADYIAFARLLQVRRPQSGVSVGLVHHRTQSLILDIELCMMERATRKTWCAPARGDAQTSGTSALFRMEEGKNFVEESAVLPALNMALQSAMSILVP